MVDRNSPYPDLSPEIPLSDEAFQALMADLGPFEAAPHVCVAVSGGADSLCLALLTARWVEKRGGRVSALTVDHGLRPEAAKEAQKVGRWLKPLGIAHHVLTWQGPKPQAAIQAEARKARYRLMSSWCRNAGALHLLLAHTMDDQAETLLLRLGSGSGNDGLAAMSAVVETPDVRLLRPLLGVRKSSLVADLKLRRQNWIEDPSNQDIAFARARIRQAMATGGMEPEDLFLAASRFGRARTALEEAAAKILARFSKVHPAGFVRLDSAFLHTAPEEVSLRALGRVMSAVGGRGYGPRLNKLERLHRGLSESHGEFSGTLGGCRVVAEGNGILVCRENRNLPEPVEVYPGLRLTWDGRFSVGFRGEGQGLLSPLGADGWSEIVQTSPELRQSPVPAPVRGSLPALFDDFGVLSVPHLGFTRSPVGNLSPVMDESQSLAFSDVRFCPPNTLSNVGFFLRFPPNLLSH